MAYKDILQDKITANRSKLVEMCSDQIEARRLLDEITKDELEKSSISDFITIKEEDIEQKLLRDDYTIIKTKTGKNVMRFYGGYDIVASDREAYDGAPYHIFEMLLQQDEILANAESENQREDFKTAFQAMAEIFRMPNYVCSEPTLMYNVATAAVKYQKYLQEISSIPVDETKDRKQEVLNRFYDDLALLAEGLSDEFEKMGLEYEKRMKDAEETSEGESAPKGESEETETPPKE